MKVVKISKTISSSVINHNMVLYHDHSTEYIDEIVEDWCDNELSGHSNGWNWAWEFLTDGNEIKNVLENELIKTKRIMENLEFTKSELERHLEVIKFKI